ncbi:MAG: hypothetical protein E4G96_06605 [Chrysiogenales bacterium]|nr:MAG: hypothetical protein E4G96_06605 [Chrysiogenales bacterium]
MIPAIIILVSHLPRGNAYAEAIECWIEIQKGGVMSGSPSPETGPPIFAALRSRNLPEPRTGPFAVLSLQTDTVDQIQSMESSALVRLPETAIEVTPHGNRILSFANTISGKSRELQVLIEEAY